MSRKNRDRYVQPSPAAEVAPIATTVAPPTPAKTANGCPKCKSINLTTANVINWLKDNGYDITWTHRICKDCLHPIIERIVNQG